MQSFSIIVATYNSDNTLRDTLQSIKIQNTDNLEVILQDGGSTDRTIEIAQEYPFVDWQSEPDNGLYSAMNKGIKRSKGEIVGILNSDDFYPDNQVIERVNALFTEDPELDAVYGSLKYVNAKDTNKVIRHWKSGPYRLEAWRQGWMPPHPTFFVRKSVYERFGGFREELRFAADYEFMLRCCYKERIKVRRIPYVLVHMRVGGVSNSSLSNRLKANKEDRLAWKLNELVPPAFLSMKKPLRKVQQWLRPMVLRWPR